MNSKILRKLMAVADRPKEESKPPMATDTDSKFVWTIGADVMKTFRRYGFVPPTEYRNDYLFKVNREAKNDGDK